MTTLVQPSFDEYVTARSGALLRFAFVLCGDRHLAEDLVQEVLIKAHRRWSAIEADNPDAYLKQAIVRTHVSWRRRRATTEIATDTFAEAAADRFDDSHADRDELWAMLAKLPRAQRAVLVLRYFEDLDDARIAEVTGVSASTVRTHAARGLTALREAMVQHAAQAPAGAGMLQTVQRGAARATARRRLAAAGGIAVLIIAIALGIPLLSPAPATPIDPSPSVSDSTSLPPSPGPNTSTDPLANMTLRVPPWTSVGFGYGECTSGEITFADGRFAEPNGLLVTHIGGSFPVTLDGVAAYVTHLYCFGPGEGGVEQIVAYKAAADHAYLGVVLTVTDLDDVASATAAGTADDVSVDYAHKLASGSDVPDYTVLHQTRTYHWTGTAFVQTEGPTSAAADTDLTFTPGPLAFGAPVNGCRTGTLTVSITNHGTAAVTDLAVVTFIGRPEDRADGPCTTEADSGYRSLSLSIPPGATRTATVTYLKGDPLDIADTTFVALTTTGNAQTAAEVVTVPVTVA